MMIKTPFRFLHAADLLLEIPIAGIGEGADSIEKRLLDAPMEAARRLFQHARTEQVDFVVLSGNVVDPNTSGPGPLVFLLEQFRLLAEDEIPVYWAGGAFDGPDHWPAPLFLPENVHFFRTASVEDFLFTKGNIPVARILGSSRGNRPARIAPSEFTPDINGLYTVAAVNGRIDPAVAQDRRIHYWALGGSKKRWTAQFEWEKEEDHVSRLSPHTNPHVSPHGSGVAERKGKVFLEHEKQYSTLHYPGPTLARSPNDSDRYGGTLVEVDVNGIATLTLLPCSPILWVEERIELESGSTLKQLRSEMQQRIHGFRTLKNRDDLMISWIVDCPGGPLPTDLRTGKVGEQLLEELRIDFGLEPPICWSVSLTATRPEVYPTSVYEQKTILGDYLRSIRHFQARIRQPINLQPFLPKNENDIPVGTDLSFPLPEEPRKGKSGKKPSQRRIQRYKKLVKRRSKLFRSVLKDAAALGWDLLGETNDRKSER